MAVPDFSDVQSDADADLEQMPNSSLIWNELRYWISVLAGFALMIGYKTIFPTQPPFIDICVVILASCLIAFMAGFSVRRVIVGILKGALGSM